MGAMRRFQHGQRARHANRPPAGHGFQEGHGPAIAQEQRGRCGSGRGFPPIPGFHATIGSAAKHDEGTATNAGGLRFHERQHRLHGDCGIQR